MKKLAIIFFIGTLLTMPITLNLAFSSYIEGKSICWIWLLIFLADIRYL